jgi:hypothetical protein
MQFELEGETVILLVCGHKRNRLVANIQTRTLKTKGFCVYCIRISAPTCPMTTTLRTVPKYDLNGDGEEKGTAASGSRIGANNICFKICAIFKSLARVGT